MHGIELAGGLGWVVNLHGSTHPFEQGQADQRLSHATALAWAGDGAADPRRRPQPDAAPGTPG